MDAYLIGASEFVDEPWLLKTTPLRTEEIGLGHEIHQQADIFDLISNFNLGFTTFFYYFSTLLTSLLLFLFIKLLSKETTRVMSIHRAAVSGLRSAKISPLMSLFSNNQKQSIKLFLLFFGLFQWHARLFLTNGIKTNKASTSLKFGYCFDF